jgi:hypothetical protein
MRASSTEDLIAYPADTKQLQDCSDLVTGNKPRSALAGVPSVAQETVTASSLLKSAEPTENSLNRLTSIARSLLIYMDSGSHCVWPERRIGVQYRVFQQAARA